MVLADTLVSARRRLRMRAAIRTYRPIPSCNRFASMPLLLLDPYAFDTSHPIESHVRAGQLFGGEATMTQHENVQSTAKARTTEGRAGASDIVDAWATFIIPHMTILPRFSVGRILLHLLAMLGDRCIRFHVAGIMRELPWLPQH